MGNQAEIQKLAGKIKAQGFESICFCFPSYGVGGGVLSFYRFAEYLRKNTDISISYVDYEDGYLSDMLRGLDIRVIPYCDEQRAFDMDEKAVVITNSTRPILLKKMRPDNKLLFWHYETAPCAWERIFLQNETQDYFRLCHEKRAMVFHDWSSWDALSQDAGFEFEKLYLPLCIEPRRFMAGGELISDEEMHLTWLGRLVPDKMYSLLYLINYYAQYATSRRKVLHIIGDGRSRAEIEAYCKRFYNKITFDFQGTVTGDELDEFLIEHTDVLFAMGTSLLEGAALKIPTVVVLLNTAQIKTDEFFWIFNSKEYCCGVMTSQARRFGAEYSYFRDMMDDIYEYGMKKEYGEKSFQYYEENHSSMGRVARLLLSAVNQSSLTMDDLERCIKYVPYQHIRVVKRSLLGRKLPDHVIFETGGEEQ